MTRQLTNWLQSYKDYTTITESPAKMHFWVGVSCLAGAVRRKTWIDMLTFKIYPSMYIILVAPPGVVSKTTTLDLGMEILRKVPGINFGPDAISWQKLAKKMGELTELFEFEGKALPMSAITLASGELGNLINPQDRELLTFYITLWDSKNHFSKETKTSGSDSIESPWVNMVGCTTPHWIADNMPSAVIGGGFTSRCIFVYAEKKERYIAYPDELLQDSSYVELRSKLLSDLTHISKSIVGPFKITEEARVWGRQWYQDLWKYLENNMENKTIEAYMSRKYIFLHKTALLLSVAKSDSRIIEKEDLVIANISLEELEKDMDKVFSKIGRSEESLQTEVLLEYIRRSRVVSYNKAYQQVFSAFPNHHSFEGVINGLIRAGFITMTTRNSEVILTYCYQEE